METTQIVGHGTRKGGLVVLVSWSQGGLLQRNVRDSWKKFCKPSSTGIYPDSRCHKTVSNLVVHYILHGMHGPQLEIR